MDREKEEGRGCVGVSDEWFCYACDKWQPTGKVHWCGMSATEFQGHRCRVPDDVQPDMEKRPDGFQGERYLVGSLPLTMEEEAEITERVNEIARRLLDVQPDVIATKLANPGPIS